MKKWMLVLSVLNVVTVAQLSSRVVHAAEVCDTVKSCRALQAKVEARLAVLLKNALPKLPPHLSDAPRENGRVRTMTQGEAESYCRRQGEHLPTAHELALYTQSLGAQGFNETWKDGYSPMMTLDSEGNADDFYYSNQGYQHPTDILGNRGLWSSSVPPGMTNFAYVLNDDGAFFTDLSWVDGAHAVRCVRSR